MAAVVLDRFSGDGNPEDWIYRAERYFTYVGFSEEHWLPLPSLYLDGAALEWFRWMFRNNQFFDWNHFKEKLALRFPQRTCAKSSVVNAQLTSILALLQKLEDKCSFMSQQVIVKDTRFNAGTTLSGATCPLAEETSSPGDNDEGYSELLNTSVDEHSSHVDHVFDEISTGVFTKEVEKTSSASSFLADSEDIQSPKVFNTFFHSCCPKAIAEVQPETPIKMIDVEAPIPDHSTVHLFDECPPRDMSKRYITALSLDHGSSNQKIEFETFDDMYLPEFLLEPETYLNHDRFFLKIEANILPSNMPSYEMLLVVKHEKTTDEFIAYKILSQFLFDPRVNSSIVSVHGTSMYPSVWDPGVCLNSMAPTSYTNTLNADPLQLLGSTDMCCFIPYANFTTQVWDPGRQLSWKPNIVRLTENRLVGGEINGISLTITEGNNAESQKEGSQSSRDGLHSTTNTSTLLSTKDWKYFVKCLALPRRTINIVMISKGQTKIVKQSYIRHLRQSLGQRDTTICFLLLTSIYYALLEPYMHTLFVLAPEASDKVEDVVALQEIDLWNGSANHWPLHLRKFP